jgi:hypothetical protein
MSTKLTPYYGTQKSMSYEVQPMSNKECAKKILRRYKRRSSEGNKIHDISREGRVLV